ncbi:class I SAM-dependent methyltransferase [Alkalicoccobacillus plakortidis]|uniref:Class I SAM-dependent methyltransferase n=1 Tax=Alkalicoccobacillus plakortidis TaxID=444060 RepID=A0ABT0XHL9_9BACI|nr:class I SAM-dependent methyltransferase [Alkalicoccobacillus plakortidis]MCM2675401.1 class I SAM-dependent methyltransferase [Alkalicoccobacillus plakortidis]
MDQKSLTTNQNKQAWNDESYQAWVTRFGTPEDAALKIKENPQKPLVTLLPHFGEVSGTRIMNLMGSNGTKAVPLALLGADVTVADFSEGNQRYALELADAADVSISYLLGDVLDLKLEDQEPYQLVFAEMGILHYFKDLIPFFQMIHALLDQGGECVIRDFHPVSTKLITSKGTTAKIRKHKVTGDYFDTSLTEQNVSYSKYDADNASTVLLRKWTLGDIVTSAAQAGLVIRSLIEEPNLSSDVFDKGIPKTFVLKAYKA